ncbi:MAG: lipoate--protein ligase family protein [Candidatus Zixiibacteriota bacterium]|nr:MAG: lipoate--protein ligase family protein [candidate division Zixibacteria bacterium]
MTMMTGYYYYTPDEDPYYNMSFDDWMFEAVVKNLLDCPALLRLYSWRKPAITIGYNQDSSKIVDYTALEPGFPVIRRITGGRAIYHDPTEVTFSFATAFDMVPAKTRSLSGTNRLISETVVEILNAVGIKACWARHSDPSYSGRGKGKVRSCFDSTARYEILLDGEKIVGGAQRSEGSFLIHQSSIKINGISDFPVIGQVGRKTARSGSRGESGRVAPSDLRDEFCRVFSERFNLDFQERSLASRQRQRLRIMTQKLAENSLGKREFH